MKRPGPKRRHNPNIPAHIDQSKLPTGCYWDDSGNGHWYRAFKENGKPKRKRIAGPSAMLSELHQIMEDAKNPSNDTFKWAAMQYFDSHDFAGLSKKTKQDYQYSFEVVANFDTKIGVKLADVALYRWDTPLIQKFIDLISDTPTKAKHVHSFVRLVFSWSKRRGHCKENPAIGVKLPKERKKRTLPTQRAYDRLLQYAKDNGTHGQKTTGSCPHYIWAVMEINYLCYLRGVETRNLTDAHIEGDSLRAERRKGSRTNRIEFNDRLSAAVRHLIECRAAIWSKNNFAVPIQANQRPIVVNTLGERLQSRAYQSAWQRFIKSCIAQGVIEESERFSLHDLKRKGVTDTDQENAAGHRDPRMHEVYDLSEPKIKPASD